MKVFRAYADEWRGVFHCYIQVRFFDSRRQMHADMRKEGWSASSDVQGQCSGIAHYNQAGRMTGRFALMWLNATDVRRNPAEIVAHECIHAAMRHMFNRNIDLSDMVGEEALAYTAGSLTKQINNRLHSFGVFET